VPTDVSEEHIASIFRVEEISSARNQQAGKQAEDDTLHNPRCGNFKSYNKTMIEVTVL
jgi:hypothetical protein